MKVSNSFHNFW